MWEATAELEFYVGGCRSRFVPLCASAMKERNVLFGVKFS